MNLDQRYPVRAWVAALVVFLLLLPGLVWLIELISTGNGWRLWKIWGALLAACYWPLAQSVLRRRYGEQRAAGDVVRQAAQNAAMVRRFFAYFMPVVAVYFLTFSAYDLGPALRSSRSDGKIGTLFITERDCPQRGRSCSYFGDFRSDDDTVFRSHVRMHDPANQSLRVGDVIRTIDTGDRTGVFPTSGSTNWIFDAAFVVLSSTYLLWWASWRHGPRRLFRRLLPSRARNLP